MLAFAAEAIPFLGLPGGAGWHIGWPPWADRTRGYRLGQRRGAQENQNDVGGGAGLGPVSNRTLACGVLWRLAIILASGSGQNAVGAAAGYGAASG